MLHRRIQVESVAACGARDDLLHLAIRGVQQSAGFGSSLHRDRVGRTGGAQIRALRRVHCDVEFGKVGAGLGRSATLAHCACRRNGGFFHHLNDIER